MSKRRGDDSISAAPKTKAVNLEYSVVRSLNPRFADVRAMWPPPRRNAALVPGMRCNDRNHLRFSYGGMFLGARYARARGRGEELEEHKYARIPIDRENLPGRDESLPGTRARSFRANETSIGSNYRACNVAPIRNSNYAFDNARDRPLGGLDRSRCIRTSRRERLWTHNERIVERGFFRESTIAWSVEKTLLLRP